MSDPADGGTGRRRVIFQEEVAPAQVYGVWPVTALAVFAVVVAVATTIAAGHLRHTTFWWVPGGAWTAVAIGCYGMWHMRWHRRRVRAESRRTP